jgi:hypothetical protein
VVTGRTIPLAIDLVDVIGVNISELGLYPQKVVV